MTPSDFLPSRASRSWQSDRTGAECDFYLGADSGNALEIVVTETDSQPRKDFLQNTYTDRRDGRVSPVLIVALYDNGTADLCGPIEETPVVYRDVDAGQASRICDVALDKPNRHGAERFLVETLPQLDDNLPGIRNQGLLSTHELKVGVPERDDWTRATTKALEAVTDDPRAMLRGLDYDIERLTDQSYVLKHTEHGRESAVAVFLQENESFDHKHDRFVGDTPVAYALNEADKKNLDYVIGSDGDTLRLYTTNPEAGFGSRGQTDTYVEVNTNLLADDKAGYLWLLFSAHALQDEGSLHDIMERSKDYAADLGARLRERIYDDVVPALAEAIARGRDFDDPDKEQLDQTYEMTLVLLYRLLFIAYTEDEEFLPRRRNDQYDARSLKQKARNLHESVQEDREFDENLTTHWDDVMTLTRAIHNGNSEWGLPEYDGRLLSEDPDWSPAGAKLADVQLTDAEFGPVLVNLLIDETEDGFQGPVDFRNIGVREFGVIYEGLLESELSVADQSLTTEINDGDEQYVPADEDDEVVIEEGEIYLHGQSGERKATGTYYTKTRFVEHLLDYSLDPALDEHIERIDHLREEEGDAAAANAFFDLRVADIAMGSGHFLVGAIDRIEARLYSYLTDNTLAGVEEELDNLEDAALSAFEDEEYTPPIERGQLLRRQVARRCIYGVDLNPLATELARLSLWVHTFVPGLPLTFLDYNLTTGDSLAGIGTLDEISDLLDMDQTSLGMFMGGKDVMSEIRDEIEHLGTFADTSAEQVAEARRTREQIDEALKPVQARFDILAASRIDDDVNPNAASKTDVDPTTLSSYERAQKVLKSTSPLHFPAAFPEVFMDGSGFDVIVGNPPWEQAKVEGVSFWTRHYPGIRSMSRRDRKSRIAELEQKRPDLVEELENRQKGAEKKAKFLTKGPYEGVGSGDPDMYQAFCWRFWQLIQEDGKVGVVLPREAFMQKGSEAFRRRVIEDGTFLDLTFIKNRSRWAFEMEPRYTIGLATLAKTPPTEGTAVPIRGPYATVSEFEQGVESDPFWFDVDEVKAWTDVCAFPLFPPVKRAVEAFGELQQAPRLDLDETGRAKAVPYRTGITSSDCADDPSDDCWPVYKGSSFDIWNPETGDYYGWGDIDRLSSYVSDKRENSRKWPDNDRELPCFRPVIAFRRVTNRTNSRTTIASLIPPKVFMRDADPFLLWEGGDEKDEAYLIGILSSIPLDWYSRRFVEKHLDYYIFNGLPVPRPDDSSRLRKRVVKLSGRLAAVDDRYADWADAVGVEYGELDDDTKEDKIYELDAIISHLYGLTRENIEIIFETFHDNWDHEPRMNAVLEYYDEWAEELDLDHKAEPVEAAEDD